MNVAIEEIKGHSPTLSSFSDDGSRVSSETIDSTSSEATSFTLKNSLAQQFADYHVEAIDKTKSFKFINKATVCTSVALIAMIETIVRGLFALITLPALGAVAAFKWKAGTNFFINNGKALGVSFMAIFNSPFIFNLAKQKRELNLLLSNFQSAEADAAQARAETLQVKELAKRTIASLRSGNQELVDAADTLSQQAMAQTQVAQATVALAISAARDIVEAARKDAAEARLETVELREYFQGKRVSEEAQLQQLMATGLGTLRAAEEAAAAALEERDAALEERDAALEAAEEANALVQELEGQREQMANISFAKDASSAINNIMLEVYSKADVAYTSVLDAQNAAQRVYGLLRFIRSNTETAIRVGTNTHVNSEAQAAAQYAFKAQAAAEEARVLASQAAAIATQANNDTLAAGTDVNKLADSAFISVFDPELHRIAMGAKADAFARAAITRTAIIFARATNEIAEAVEAMAKSASNIATTAVTVALAAQKVVDKEPDAAERVNEVISAIAASDASFETMKDMPKKLAECMTNAFRAR